MTASRRPIKTDLTRLDAHRIAPEEYADAPELTDEMLSRAVVRKRGRPPLGEVAKRSVTLRLDPDVIDAFKAKGPGWQTAINAALRRAARLGKRAS